MFFSLADMVALLTTSRSNLRTGQVSGREAGSA
jgi:hypothetical protein